jgi:paraquat-inducible protein A
MSHFEHLQVPDRYVACHECDTLQQLARLAPGQCARCVCCGGRLARNPKGGVDRLLALNVTALILLLLANSFPFLFMRIQGRMQDTTLIGASRALYEAGMGELAVLVLITSVVAPGLIITSTLYVLIGIRFAWPLPMLRTLLNWISHLVPWSMLDVFMLGVLVAFVKLAGMAEMLVGPSLYAFVALIVVSAAALSAFEPRLLWQRLTRAGVNR